MECRMWLTQSHGIAMSMDHLPTFQDSKEMDQLRFLVGLPGFSNQRELPATLHSTF